jgi:hypothetical protein
LVRCSNAQRLPDEEGVGMKRRDLKCLAIGSIASLLGFSFGFLVRTGTESHLNHKGMAKLILEQQRLDLYRRTLLIYLWPDGEGLTTTMQFARHIQTFYAGMSDREIAESTDFSRALVIAMEPSDSPDYIDSSTEVFSIYLCVGEKRFEMIVSSALTEQVSRFEGYSDVRKKLNVVPALFRDFVKSVDKQLLNDTIPKPSDSKLFAK